MLEWTWPVVVVAWEVTGTSEKAKAEARPFLSGADEKH